MCWLDWPWVPRSNTISECVCEGVLGVSTSTWVNGLRQAGGPPAWGHHPICWRPEQNTQNKRRGRRKSSFPCLTCWAGHLTSPSPALRLTFTPGTTLFSGLWTPLNYTTSFPGPSACRRETMGLLSLPNHMSCFLKTNLLNIQGPAEVRLAWVWLVG